jgi:succinate dehydrogenase / fumarate reductase flavoprotein subunit
MEEKYPEFGNLMPRDIVSREMVTVCSQEDCEAQIYLDMTNIPSKIWEKQLYEIKDKCIRYLNINPEKEFVPVAPGIHYFMGGVLVDAMHRTNIQYLYAAGECASQYHGANRLGGNSTLGAIYGGIVAANTATDRVSENEITYQKKNSFCYHFESSADSIIAKLNASLLNGLGIVRTGQEMEHSLKEIKALQEIENLPVSTRDRVLLGVAMVKSALARKESRGAHYRSDYQKSNDTYRKTTVVSFDGKNIDIDFLNIPLAHGGA